MRPIIFILLLFLLIGGYLIVISNVPNWSFSNKENIEEGTIIEESSQGGGGFYEKISISEGIDVVIKQNSRHKFYGTPIILSEGIYSNSYIDIFDLGKLYIPLNVRGVDYKLYHYLFSFTIFLSLVIFIFLDRKKEFERRYKQNE